MESVFLVVLQKWGPAAVSVLLIFVVSFLIREIKKYSDAEKNHIAGLHKDISKMREDVNNSLNSFGERLSKVEHDYVKNDMFYRELSGWRSEINKLSDQINSNHTMLIQNILQFVRKGEL